MDNALPIAIFLNPSDQCLHPEGLGLVDAASQGDIAGYLGARRVESISTASDFGRLDFWLHPVGQMSQRVNRPATELLLAATQLTARTVPLMRGPVVVTSHDANGELVGLTRQQLSRVASHQSRSVDQWVLDWRYRAEGRALRRRLKAHRSGADRAVWERFKNTVPPPRPHSDQ